LIKSSKIYNGNFLRIFCVVIFLSVISNAKSQTKVYATNVTTSTNTDFPLKAVDQDLSTAADVRAYSGVIIFESPYAGTIELKFPTTLTANTTSYVKISAEQANLLSSLIGGALGSLLTTITGQQEFTVDVKNSAGTVVVTGDSQDAEEFATAKLSIVVNGSGEYLIKIKPDQDYDRIKITNRYATLLGVGTVRKLQVYDAFYTTGAAPCGDAAYTSFTATSVLSVASTGVTNPQNVLSSSTTDFSIIDMGALAVGGSIEQTVYFDNPSDASDTFGVRLSIPAATISAGVISNLKIIAYNGTTEVQSKTLQELLALNLLTLTAGQITTINMTPGAPIDRITVRLSSVVSLEQKINFYSVTKIPGLPVIAAYTPVCSGSSASITASSTLAGAQFKWYDSASATNLVATTTSGQAFITPALIASKTYYVLQTAGSCTSLLQAVPVVVVSKPSAGSIAGIQSICLPNLPAQITSVSADTGTGISYRWESSIDQAIWTAIAPSNTVNYQPGALTQSTFFRRITIHTESGVQCESVPTTAIKVSTRNCVVISNPMVRQRMKNGV